MGLLRSDRQQERAASSGANLPIYDLVNAPICAVRSSTVTLPAGKRTPENRHLEAAPKWPRVCQRRPEVKGENNKK